jgi:phosphoribosyl 1,2-cyclic phosphodiesterase
MEGFCSLASGSKGNALFLGTKKAKLLIDCGISGKVLEKKLSEINVSIDEIDAVLISHEHSDHIAGLRTLAFRHNIPILTNVETAKEILNFLGERPKFKIFTTGETFIFEDIEIHPFSIQHDAIDPVGFTMRFCGVKIGICTDLGFPSTFVTNRLKGCDFLFVEANHEPSMVHASSRPAIYKTRVLGRNGHLSNESCGQLLKSVLHDKLKHIQLGHLSQECNTPTTALKVVRQSIGDDFNISIASQDTLATPINF